MTCTIRRPRTLPLAPVLLLMLGLAIPSFAEEPAAPAAEPSATPPEETPGGSAPEEPGQPPGEPGEIQPTQNPSDFVIPVEEIDKTAARSARDVLDVPGDVTKITREQIERSGARDVPELLRREAGVFVTNSTTNREGYVVEFRGFNNGGGNGSSTLVLLDGRRVNEPATSNPDWAFIPLDNVESIEVARGPASALYGDNAVAGVVHIRTLRPEKGLRAIVRGRSGSFDTDGGSAWLGGGAGPVTASAFFDGYQTDGYRDHSGAATAPAARWTSPWTSSDAASSACAAATTARGASGRAPSPRRRSTTTRARRRPAASRTCARPASASASSGSTSS